MGKLGQYFGSSSIGLFSTLICFSATANDSQQIADQSVRYFNENQKTLRDHLDVPLSDKALADSVEYEYRSIQDGNLPAAWRKKILDRFLRLVGASGKGGSLGGASKEAAEKALKTLASSDASAADKESALKQLASLTGADPTAAANALTDAVGSSEFGPGFSNQFAANINVAVNGINSNSNGGNSLNFASINSPANVRYQSEGRVTNVASGYKPRPGSLAMGPLAGNLGGSSGGSGIYSGTAARAFVGNGDGTGGTDKSAVAAHALSTMTNKLLNKGGSKSSNNKSKSSVLPSYKPSYSSSSDKANPLGNTTLMEKKKGQSAGILPKYDPSVALGGDFRKTYEKAIDEAIASRRKTSGSGSTVVEANIAKSINSELQACRENLQTQLKIKKYDPTDNKQLKALRAHIDKAGSSTDGEDLNTRLKKNLSVFKFDGDYKQNLSNMIQTEMDEEIGRRLGLYSHFMTDTDPLCYIAGQPGMSITKCRELQKTNPEINCPKHCEQFKDDNPLGNHSKLLAFTRFIKRASSPEILRSFKTLSSGELGQYVPESGDPAKTRFKIKEATNQVKGAVNTQIHSALLARAHRVNDSTFTEQDAKQMADKISSDSTDKDIIQLMIHADWKPGKGKGFVNLDPLFECTGNQGTWAQQVQKMEIDLRHYIFRECSGASRDYIIDNILNAEGTYSGFKTSKGSSIFNPINSPKTDFYEAAEEFVSSLPQGKGLKAFAQFSTPLPITESNCSQNMPIIGDKNAVVPSEKDFTDFFGLAENKAQFKGNQAEKTSQTCSDAERYHRTLVQISDRMFQACRNNVKNNTNSKSQQHQK